MKNLQKMSFCGIYCGSCKNFMANLNCSGCRLDDKLLIDCPTRYCAMEKGLIHCGVCDDFPCPELLRFYHDGSNLHRQAFDNMMKIKEMGLEMWLSLQEGNDG